MWSAKPYEKVIWRSGYWCVNLVTIWLGRGKLSTFTRTIRLWPPHCQTFSISWSVNFGLYLTRRFFRMFLGWTDGFAMEVNIAPGNPPKRTGKLFQRKKILPSPRKYCLYNGLWISWSRSSERLGNLQRIQTFDLCKLCFFDNTAFRNWLPGAGTSASENRTTSKASGTLKGLKYAPRNSFEAEPRLSVRAHMMKI